MVDTECWQKMVEILTVAQQARRPGSQPRDEFGDIHVILFGAGCSVWVEACTPRMFSRMAVCAPPSHVTLSSYRRAHRRTVAFTRILLATVCVVKCSVQLKRSHQAPFIRLPGVHNYLDFLAGALHVLTALHMFASFCCPPFAEQHPQVLRQNRRVTKDAGEGRQKELENFHGVLMDISEGKATPRVRAFIARLLVWRNRGLVRLFAFGGGGLGVQLSGRSLREGSGFVRWLSGEGGHRKQHRCVHEASVQVSRLEA